MRLLPLLLLAGCFQPNSAAPVAIAGPAAAGKASPKAAAAPPRAEASSGQGAVGIGKVVGAEQAEIKPKLDLTAELQASLVALNESIRAQISAGRDNTTTINQVGPMYLLIVGLLYGFIRLEKAVLRSCRAGLPGPPGPRPEPTAAPSPNGSAGSPARFIVAVLGGGPLLAILLALGGVACSPVGIEVGGADVYRDRFRKSAEHGLHYERRADGTEIFDIRRDDGLRSDGVGAGIRAGLRPGGAP